ncbi:MAG: PepSY-like domain-containing protein [Bacteroidota bacterium]|nr:PepSY-like domain-containing protein [Bacteroidota bacterium]
MIRKVFLLLFISFTVIANTLLAQIRQIPKAVEETFSQQYNGATNVDYKDQLVRVDISFELNGDRMLASYTNKGVWKGTEKEWTFDQLPDEVKDGFHKSKYADREVEETKVLYLPGGSTQYRLKAKKSGVEKKYLFFNTKGRLLRESITL